MTFGDKAHTSWLKRMESIRDGKHIELTPEQSLRNCIDLGCKTISIDVAIGLKKEIDILRAQLVASFETLNDATGEKK